MKADPKVVTATKLKQTKEIQEAFSKSGAPGLDQALASAQKRLTKAIELFEQNQVIEFGNRKCTFIVGEYLVTCERLIVGCQCSAEVHCQCEDHKHRSVRCKHLLAAGLFLRSLKAEREGCNV